jgi:hypothetical protein
MTNDEVYRVDFKKLLTWLIPWRLLQPRVLNWLFSLLLPLQQLYTAFWKYRRATIYHLRITPQVCFLEKLLNDRYDFTQRRIYIDDGMDKNPLHIFIYEELKPKFVFKNNEAKPKYIYTSGESGLFKDDFVVNVPAGLVYDENEMSSLLKVYKLAGSKFKIQVYY